MSCQLLWGAIDITNHTIAYSRDENICNSTGNLDVSIEGSCPHNFVPSGSITLYENSVKVGVYLITAITEDFPGYSIGLTCGNASQKLLNHFIAEKYYIIDDPLLKSRYWIEKFMTEAGVGYSFDIQTGNTDGQFLPDDQILGASIALDEIRKLLSYSGWFMRVDPNGNFVVGDLEYESESYNASIDDDDILTIKTEENDELLRNRIVVWGMGNPVCSGYIFADIHAHTPWNYDENDLRTAVISNQNIDDPTVAMSIASQALKEFTKPNYIKTVEIAGFINARLGDRVLVSSKYITSICTLTTITSNMSKDGETTTLVLDERCPRLIGYFNPGGSVYIGTKGQGVWKKNIKYDQTWYDFSTGMTDPYINDLNISAGVYSATSDSGKLFIRYPSDLSWSEQPVPILTDSNSIIYPPSSGYYSRSTIDKMDSSILAGINLKNTFSTASGNYIIDSNARSWAAKINNGVAPILTPITVSGVGHTAILDIDNNGYNSYITVYDGNSVASVSGYKLFSDTIRERVVCATDFGASNYVVYGDHFYAGALMEIGQQHRTISGYSPGVVDFETYFGYSDNNFHYPGDFSGAFFFSDVRIRLKNNSKFKCHIDKAPTDCYFTFYLINDALQDLGTYGPSVSTVGFIPSAQKLLADPHDTEYIFPPELENQTINHIAFQIISLSDKYWIDGEPMFESGTFYNEADFSDMHFENVTYDGATGYSWNDPILLEDVATVSGYSLASPIIRYNSGNLTYLDQWPGNAYNIDCSKDLPVVLYGGQEYYNQGDFDWMPDGEHLLGFNELLYTTSGIAYSGYTYSGYSGGFPIGMQYISDYRTMDVTTTDSYGRYGMIAQRMMTSSGTSNIRLIRYDPNYSGIIMNNYWTQFSGFIHKLESSNKMDYPHIFVSTVDSITASGIGGNMLVGNDIVMSGWHFWQKNGYYLNKLPGTLPTFTERSINLPQCEITCIRCDEVI